MSRERSNWKRAHRHLARLGWTQRPGKGSHVQLRSPDGKHIIHTSATGSTDWRAWPNFLANLRRAGVDTRKIA